MRPLIVPALYLLCLQAVAKAQSGVPMVEIESCQIEFTSEAINQGRWGGQIAVYDVSVGAQGRATNIERRQIARSEYLVQWVKLSQVEDCLGRWRFEQPGSYVVSLAGGTVLGPAWIIDVSGSNGRLRLKLPWPRH